MQKKIKIGKPKLAIPLIVFIITWEILSLILGPERLPDILNIFKVLVSDFSQNAIIAAQGGGENGIYPHLLITFINCNIGILIGGCLGCLIGILMFEIPFLSYLLDPFIEFIRIVPPLIFIPFLLLLFNPGNLSQILIIVVYSSYSMFIYSFNALRNIKQNYIFIATIFNTSKLDKVTKIYLPAIVPESLGGIRVTSSIAFGIIIVSEYLGAPDGIGRVIKYALSYTDITLILVGIILVVLMALLNDFIFIILFKKIVKWN